jgi:hypothetical protein
VNFGYQHTGVPLNGADIAIFEKVSASSVALLSFTLHERRASERNREAEMREARRLGRAYLDKQSVGKLRAATRILL